MNYKDILLKNVDVHLMTYIILTKGYFVCHLRQILYTTTMLKTLLGI